MIQGRFSLSCGGCDEQVEIGPLLINNRFHGFNGKDYGFGVYHIEWPNLEALAPEGWVAFDPYTQCCYCPECWASIVETDEAVIEDA